MNALPPSIVSIVHIWIWPKWKRIEWSELILSNWITEEQGSAPKHLSWLEISHYKAHFLHTLEDGFIIRPFYMDIHIKLPRNIASVVHIRTRPKWKRIEWSELILSNWITEEGGSAHNISLLRIDLQNTRIRWNTQHTCTQKQDNNGAQRFNVETLKWEKTTGTEIHCV